MLFRPKLNEVLFWRGTVGIIDGCNLIHKAIGRCYVENFHPVVVEAQ
jgi:hypothetical protein